MMNGAGAGGGNSSNDLANMLKPALGKGDIKVVASTTWDEYRKYFEKDRALMRRFQRVSVDEPDKKTTTDILQGIKKYYEEFHATTITQEAIDESVKLSIKYITDKKLPDKAIDLLDLACSRFKVNNVEGERIVGPEEVKYELAKFVNLPPEQIQQKETNNLATLDKNLKLNVYGQDNAIEEIVDKIAPAPRLKDSIVLQQMRQKVLESLPERTWICGNCGHAWERRRVTKPTRCPKCARPFNKNDT